MKVKRLIDLEIEIELDIAGVTLLSIEVAKELPKEILSYCRFWWLRSPGHFECLATGVFSDGSISERGLSVSFDCGAVRPVFIISNLNSYNLNFGDKIIIAGIKATVISETMALADESVGNTCFCEDWKAPDANVYEKSDIKRWLEEWWENLSNG